LEFCSLLFSAQHSRADDYRVKWEAQQQLVAQLNAELLQIATAKQKQASQRNWRIALTMSRICWIHKPLGRSANQIETLGAPSFQ
ncbi:MAG: hypothetical protein ACK5DL_09135, partial [Burkholderiales bacterium]